MGYTTPEDQAEKESLSDSDTVKLKQREVEIKSQLEGLKEYYRKTEAGRGEKRKISGNRAENTTSISEK